MDSCCEARSGALSRVSVCPTCGQPGKLVDRQTVQALLRPEELTRLGSAEYRFCEQPGCAVVYYGESDSFEVQDVAVPVFQKEPPGARIVCYCFNVTETDIRREIVESGESTRSRWISSLVKSGRCACELRNPQGSCCLGNVASVSKSLSISGPR